MPMSTEASKVAAMPVPTYGATWTLFFYGFVLFFTTLAIYYLINFASMPLPPVLASIAWLSLVLLCILSNISEDGGIKKHLVIRLGQFSKRHWIWAISPSIEPAHLCFGYEMFGREFHYLRIPCTEVVSIEWNSGQATSMGGRDMNDWTVALWYRDPNHSKRWRFPGMREEEVYIIGPSGRKKDIEHIGHAVVSFLQKAGIELAVTDNPNVFRAAKTN